MLAKTLEPVSFIDPDPIACIVLRLRSLGLAVEGLDERADIAQRVPHDSITLSRGPRKLTTLLGEYPFWSISSNLLKVLYFPVGCGGDLFKHVPP
jgi:hypothetical protein